MPIRQGAGKSFRNCSFGLLIFSKGLNLVCLGQADRHRGAEALEAEKVCLAAAMQKLQKTFTKRH